MENKVKNVQQYIYIYYMIYKTKKVYWNLTQEEITLCCDQETVRSTEKQVYSTLPQHKNICSYPLF